MSFQIFICDPWESWIQEMVASNERERRVYDLERDIQWEIDNGLHDEEAPVEYVPVELLAEVQRG